MTHLDLTTIEVGVPLGRRWEHERTLEPVGDAITSVHDRITFEPRIRLVAGLLGVVVRAFFARRHRRLARHFG